MFLRVLLCWLSHVDGAVCGSLQRPDRSSWRQDRAVSQSSPRQPEAGLPASEDANPCSMQVRAGLRAGLGVHGVTCLVPFVCFYKDCLFLEQCKAHSRIEGKVWRRPTPERACMDGSRSPRSTVHGGARSRWCTLCGSDSRVGTGGRPYSVLQSRFP